MHLSIAQLLGQQSGYLQKTVVLKGWVRTRRDAKAGLSFLSIHDGSCQAALQVVVSAELENYDTEVLKLTKDCSVMVTGVLVPSQGKGQSVELQATAVTVCGWVEDPETYPISPKRHTVEHLREYLHLRVRTNLMGAVTRVRHGVAQAIHRFFHEAGFFWVNTPVITASDCEGAGALFKVSTLDFANLPKTTSGAVDFRADFFGRPAYLTVSGQLNAECYALGMSKVYTFGPTFRAENSNTSRHLAEFWMVEPEVAFADLSDNAALAEALLKSVLKSVFEEREDDLAFLNQWVDKQLLARLQHVLETPFTRMAYTEAVQLLSAHAQRFEYPVTWGVDFQSEHERFLCEHHVQGPTILMDYPKAIKPFYMRVNADEKTVAAMDVLVPGVGEIIGGSQREERLSVLDERITALGMQVSDYAWYRDLRRYGTVPHAGFGLGFERLVSYITGVNNVRDIHPFPRVPGHVDC